LEDFFPSIHFGRVKGMFMSKPYELPLTVARDLANICCHPVTKTLPQGAPTSPVVSNMICGTLDFGLRKLAEEHHCTYTRYADDLTFSTTRKLFPKQIVEVIDPLDLKAGWKIGDAVQQVIIANSFRINQKKVRLRRLGQRFEVTGLVVGTGVNIPREYIRSVRGMLHAWEKH